MAHGSTLDHFNVALITGGNGGLGKAMARAFVERGKKVVIAGRTKKTLDETAHELGPGVVASYVVDVSKVDELAAFAQKMIKEHPEIDCLINNAGVSKVIDLKKEKLDLDEVVQDLHINVTSVVLLSSYFIPHLQSKSSAVLANLTSGLAYLPLAKYPIYNATKAFIKSFTLSLRVQLKDTAVKVIEIAPPKVESNLLARYGEAEDGVPAITQEQYVKELMEGLETDKLTIGIGFVKGVAETWDATFGDQWAKMNQLS